MTIYSDAVRYRVLAASVLLAAAVFVVLVSSMGAIALNHRGSFLSTIMQRIRVVSFLSLASFAGIFVAAPAALLPRPRAGGVAILTLLLLLFGLTIMLLVSSTSTRNISISITPDNAAYWASLLNNP